MYQVVKRSFITRNLILNKNHMVPAEPLVVVGFDDGIISDYSVAFPYMTERNIKGTSYLITSRVGTASRVTWEHVHEMLASGMWEFGCHTHTHPNLTQITAEQIREEMELVNAAFIENGLEPPKHHAHPYGATNSSVKNIIKEYRETQRNTNYNTTDVNRYGSVNYNSMRAIKGDTNDDQQLQFVKDSIDYAISEKAVVELYFHQIVPNISDYPWQTARVYFEQIIDYIAEKQDQGLIKSVTHGEAVERLKAYDEQMKKVSKSGLFGLF